MSINDPGGGDVVSGGVIEGPSTGGSSIDSSPVLQSMLQWNNKTLLLPLPLGAGDDYRLGVYPLRPRTVNQTLTGRTETLGQPRMQTGVEAYWSIINDALLAREGIDSTAVSLRTKLNNWWQCAQQGMDWSFAVFANRVVYTTLGGSPVQGASAGDVVLTVADPDGIFAGNVYVLTAGPNYQEVEVVDVTGNQATIADSLDFDFSPGALFRDVFFWHGAILDTSAKSPIEDKAPPFGQFELKIEFTERIYGT